MSKRGEVLVIYADVVFIINFIMDTFILFLTSIILKKRINKLLIFFGGLVGSLLYCVLMFYEPISKYYNPLTSLFTFLIPLLLVFRPKNIREFLKAFIILNVCAFFIGGLSTALLFYTNAKNYIGELLSFSVDNFSIKFLIFSCSFTYVAIKISRLIILEKINKKQHIVNVEIKDDNNKISLNALVDTGNTLKEPIENKHVIITEFEVVKELLPNDLKLIFYEKNENDLSRITEISYDTKNNFRLIPFKSIGNENGFLIGIKVNEVIIYSENEKYVTNDIYIAIANFKLSNTDSFSALINPEIMNMKGD